MFAQHALPFDIFKQNRIAIVAGLLAITLAIAAYRQPFRRRGAAHVAIVLAMLAAMFAIRVAPF